MTTVEMLALLFGFTMIGGIAFMLLGNTGLWRHVPGARPRPGGDVRPGVDTPRRD